MITDSLMNKLTVKDIFKLSYSLFKTKLNDIIIIHALLILPFIIIMAIIGFTAQRYFNVNSTILIVLEIAIFVSFYVTIIIMTYNATLILLDRTYKNESINWKTAINLGVHKIGAMFNTGLIFMLLGLFAIIPGINILFTIYTSLTMPTVILTDNNGFKAITHSYDLIKGAEWDILFIYLIYGATAFIIELLTMLIVAPMIMTNNFNNYIFTGTSTLFCIIAFFISMYFITTIYIFYINRDMFINGINVEEINEEEPIT